MRKGYREQALGAVQAAQAEARRTDLEITDSVIRLYYGALLARQLRQVAARTKPPPGWRSSSGATSTPRSSSRPTPGH